MAVEGSLRPGDQASQLALNMNRIVYVVDRFTDGLYTLEPTF